MGNSNNSKESSSTLIHPISLFFSFFFSFKMKMSYLFLIIAGVIALGAVTAAREIEIAKRDIAAPEEDESKSLAEDPAGCEDPAGESGEAGEASLQAQLTQQRAAGMPPGMMIGSEMVRPAVQQLPCATCDDCKYKDWCHCSCESDAMVREEGNN